MKLGVFTVLLADLSLEQALDYLKGLGVQAVELGCGNYPNNAHCNPDRLLQDDSACDALLKAVQSRDMEIAALSCHGNPLHPNREFARKHAETQRETIRLAQKLGVKTVVGFSGCPGDSENAKYPNWVTCPWPPDFEAILKYQWEEVLIPFWTTKNKEAADAGVKIAFEAHPGFCVYNTETLLRLRKACGKQIGANLDPSHFFWQGMDPIEAARVLGDAKCIFHVHGKDTGIDPHNTKINGVLDTKSYGDLGARSWVFRTCGYGHGDEFWKPFISMLRIKGYDGVISIEHEDSTMSVQEGFEKAVAYLRSVLIREKAGQAWWF